MGYDICLNVAAFIFLIIAYVSTGKQYAEPTKKNKRFKMLVLSLMIALIFDTAGSLTIDNSQVINVTFNMALNAAGFINIGFCVYGYALYMESFFNESQLNMKLSRFTHITFVVYNALHILNIFFGFIFYFDENLKYTHGPVYLLTYIVPMYFFSYGAVTMIKNRRYVGKREFLATMSLFLFALVGITIQGIFLPNHLVILFTITLSLMVIFFNIETPDYRQMQEALREADSANRSKSDFLANMSHEIRTPMNAIVGMCELILRERDISPTVQEYCYNIQNSGRSLLSIINDILDFSKIESGKMELVEDEFNIASTLNDVINMAVARKGDKKLEIIVHVDPDIPAGLIGDEIRIRQIIINTVTNAIKYTKEGGVFIRVSQTKHDYGINLSVSVADTGIGITEEDLEKLFSSFQQVDTKKNRSVEGTGLGLAISKRLITTMGGFINVSSEYGRGSVFSFVIPLKVSDETPFIKVRDAENIRAAGYIGFGKFSDSRVSDEYRTLISELGDGLHTKIDLFPTMEKLKEAVESAEEKYNYIFTAREEYSANEEYFLERAKEAEIVLVQDRSEAIETPAGVRCMFKPFYALSAASVFNHENIMTNIGERRGSDTRFAAPQARVLVVDDNAINLKVAVGLMRPYHMQVVTADSAASAISLLRSKDFHIVFMDHMMPETDGVEATRMIREKEDEYYKKLPIIALTANAVNGVREMFIEAGMNDFIAKPIELSALDRVLRTWLPKELMKAHTESERYINDRRRAPEQKLESGDELFSPETGVFYTGGDAEAYFEILGMYVNKGAEKLAYIQELFDSRDWGNYVIEVHALKSSSLSVGSKLLSERAKELELAGKAGNHSLIEKKNADLLKMYGEVIKIGAQYLEKNAPHIIAAVQPDIPEELAETTLERIEEMISAVISACDSFDSDEAISICKEAAGYSYNGKPLKPLFDGIKAAAEDFEYDDAAEKAADIKEKLKGR